MTTLELSGSPTQVAAVEETGGQMRSAVVRLIKAVVGAVISVLVIAFIWQAFLWITKVDSFVGRTPGDIFRAIFTGEGAAETRRALMDASFITLRDAFFGLAAGLIVALVAAISFNMIKTIEQTVMPVAMVLQSVPLVALTPVVALILGRGQATTTVLAGIVTFFPALVNVNLALRGAPKASMDLMKAYGASKWTTLFKVQLPCALPALFASLRIAAPLAIIGALLAEWLATAEGLGYLMLKSQTGFNYDTLWAAGALITMFSVILYNIISALEGVVLAKYAPDALAARTA